VSDVDDLYDWDAFERGTTRAPTPRGVGGLPAVMLAAALSSLDDVVLAERPRQPIVEEMDVPGPDLTQPVVVFLYRGDPRRSWARVTGH
jgi:hypothetical protein